MDFTEYLAGWNSIVRDTVRSDGPDLSMRQWSVLLTVYLDPGPHTVRALARDLNVPKPAVSRALDTLSIAGFVKRTRNPADRRTVIIRKTVDGSLYLDRFAKAFKNGRYYLCHREYP